MQKSLNLLAVISGLSLVATLICFSATVRAETDYFTEAASQEGAINTTTPYSLLTITSVRTLIAEPIIRVGISKAKSFIFESAVPYSIYTRSTLRGTIPAGVTTTITYEKGRYTIKGDAVEFGADEYLRLVPADPASVFALDGYERRFEKGKINYNQYRGTLEYRYSPRSKEAYVINELPLEEYVAGIAEVASSDPIEYATAVIIAARSYAYIHLGTPPSDKHLFDVYGSTNDQLYLGYVSEMNHPNVVAAAATTSGVMITYRRNPVTALYFGRSSGQTKSWPAKDNRPWLKSVVAKYDKHKRWSGHGYGMSMNDARTHAIRDHWTASQILQYYYTGVEVEKVY